MVYEEGLKIWTLKQMLQRLLIAVAQVKASNTSENLLNDIKKIIYSLHREKEITKFNKVIKENGYNIYEI